MKPDAYSVRTLRLFERANSIAERTKKPHHAARRTRLFNAAMRRMRLDTFCTPEGR